MTKISNIFRYGFEKVIKDAKDEDTPWLEKAQLFDRNSKLKADLASFLNGKHFDPKSCKALEASWKKLEN